MKQHILLVIFAAAGLIALVAAIIDAVKRRRAAKLASIPLPVGGASPAPTNDGQDGIAQLKQED